ncbi:unnamed protein product [Urochloa decumbens]|uniref:3'-5' exonuclease domain-containing protein n=1 Tax=Urochloa decumbens TaxID=240449 RepID=A0ABC9DHP2_9POAL
MARKLTVPRHIVRVAGHAIHTTVTAHPAVARRWLHTAVWRHGRALRSASGLTVGLGVQWTPPFRRLPAGVEPRPGTLQLCAGSYCLLFQIARAGGAVPRILRRFLAHARVTFVGYNVRSDCRKLRAHHGLQVASALELRGAAASVGGNASLSDMAETLLGMRGVEKSRVATGEWDGERLSRKQVTYASVDAYVSCCLGVYLRRRRAMASQESESEYTDDDDTESMSSEASSDWG